MLEEILDRFGQMHERATVKTVFGEPYQVNGRTIIPVARVAFGLGVGGGRGTGKTERPQGSGNAEPQVPSGAGAGGGGGVSVRPVAVLEVDSSGTTVKPVVDISRLALAGMILAAWSVFWITYTIRRTQTG